MNGRRLNVAAIRAVSFDATGTLLHLPGGVGAHYAAVAEAFGCAAAPDALERAFRNVWKRVPPPATTLQPRPDDDKGWWRELVREVTAEAGATITDFDPFFEHLYAHFAQPEAWELFPEVRRVLARLGQDYPLAVVSNFDGRLRRVLDGHGLLHRFAALIISSEVGADKPAEEIFQAACNELDVPPGAMLHVGDHPVEDWAGAEEAGLQVFRLDRKSNSLRDLVVALGR